MSAEGGYQRLLPHQDARFSVSVPDEIIIEQVIREDAFIQLNCNKTTVPVWNTNIMPTTRLSEQGLTKSKLKREQCNETWAIYLSI